MDSKRCTPKRRVSAAMSRPWLPRTRSSSAACTSVGGGPFGLNESNLHVTVLQLEARARARNLGCLIERAGFDHEYAAHRVLRLDERPVDHLAAAYGEASPRLVVQLLRHHQTGAVLQTFEPG